MNEREPNPEFDIEAELERMKAEEDAARTTGEVKSTVGFAEMEGSNSFQSQLVEETQPKPTQGEYRDRWANRRRMAWIAFGAIIIVTLLNMFVLEIDKIKALETVTTWFFGAMTSIVGAYMGFATMVDLQKKK